MRCKTCMLESKLYPIIIYSFFQIYTLDSHRYKDGVSYTPFRKISDYMLMGLITLLDTYICRKETYYFIGYLHICKRSTSLHLSISSSTDLRYS